MTRTHQLGYAEALETRRLLSGGYVQVLVEPDLYAQITPELQSYAADLRRDGYSVHVIPAPGTTPSQLRSHLKYTQALRPDLSGAIFVGDVAPAMFEIGNGKPFASELYYMDLDGAWLDRDGDGVLDTHPNDGKQTPEIWISRISAGQVGDEVTVTNSYLDRLHRYRAGHLRFPKAALAFLDDDWSAYGEYSSAGLSSLYESVTTISDVERSDVTNLRRQVGSGIYEWVYSWLHSTATQMMVDGQPIAAGEIPAMNPTAGFYNWFQCSFADFTTAGFGAGQFIFASKSGLAGVGSTRAGAMLDHQYFYGPLGQGASLGEALVHWFRAVGADGYTPGEAMWYFGMALVGDGALAPAVVRPTVAEPLVVSGTEAADVITCRLEDGVWRIAVNGQERVVAAEQISSLTILGLGGDDVIDLRECDLGCVVCGGDGADTIFGGSGADTLEGNGGGDWIRGFGGADQIWGNSGNDWLHGSGGADRILGGTGGDTLLAGGGSDTLVCGAGDDVVMSSAGPLVIRGGEGWDVAYIYAYEPAEIGEVESILTLMGEPLEGVQKL